MTKLKDEKYKGYTIRIYGKELLGKGYDWVILGKGALSGEWLTYKQGYAFVDNKRQVLAIAKEFIDKYLSKF